MHKSTFLRLNVLIVDDHESILHGVTSYLKKFIIGEFTVTTEGRTGLRLVKTLPDNFDIIILDWRLKDIDGLVLIDKIRECKPNAKIIEFTMHEGIWDIKRLISRNVNGIVLKSSPIDCLRIAIEQVSKGNTYYCRRFRQLRQKNNALSKDSHLLDFDFSPMELEIIELAAKGYTSRQISELRGYNFHTIVDYRKKLFEKFEVNSIEELVAIAIYNGFITNPDEKIEEL